MNVLSLNGRYSNRKKHRPWGETEAATGFGTVPALDTAKLPTVILCKKRTCSMEEGYRMHLAGDSRSARKQQPGNLKMRTKFFFYYSMATYTPPDM